MQWFRLTVENRRNVTKFQKALSFLAELREYHHTYIYKLVKSTTSPVMHIISVAKALKNISRIYISYTVPKKNKRRMHEKFPFRFNFECDKLTMTLPLEKVFASGDNLLASIRFLFAGSGSV